MKLFQSYHCVIKSWFIELNLALSMKCHHVKFFTRGRVDVSISTYLPQCEDTFLGTYNTTFDHDIVISDFSISWESTLKFRKNY